MSRLKLARGKRRRNFFRDVIGLGFELEKIDRNGILLVT